ncbi:hypothetical protein AB1207_22135 [Kineococcus endophyticus]|uniref:Uncharacterized protein n=1 Tax=Kineococcus endophyticus TaxID=1181883 RepID=A0ABV3PCT7_9ACTN
MTETFINDEAVGSFRTHSHYLSAFAHLAGFSGVTTTERGLETLAQTLANRVPASTKPQPQPVDVGLVLDCLNRAWGTELILNMTRHTARDQDLIRLANSWGAVQLYYISYGATQALITAEGRERPTNHPGTQDQVGALWITRAFSVAPWSFAMGDPGHKESAADGSRNGPGRPLADVHAWTTCDRDNCWDIAAKALTSTRAHAIDAKLDKLRFELVAAQKKSWRAEETARRAQGKAGRKEPTWPRKGRLKPAQRAAAIAKVRPHTMVDYLFRLRIKANYEDARMFTEGPQNDLESSVVARDIVNLASATMLAHEMRIGRLIGRQVLGNAVDDWLRRNARPDERYGLGLRRELLFTHL